MHILLIHNPSAGAGRPSQAELMDLLRAIDSSATYRSIRDDGYRDALRALSSSDIVVVAGGDGTVHKVAEEVISTHVPLAIIPLGTANNIASTLGTIRHARDVVAGLEHARAVRFDAGRVTGSIDDRVFLEGLGVGVVAEMMRAVDTIKHSGAGKVGDEMQLARKKLLDVCRTSDPVRVDLRLDGNDFSGEYLMVEALNTRSIASSLDLSPEADPSDGALDVVLVPASERQSLEDFALASQSGESVPAPFTAHRAQQVKMTWQTAPLHVDDWLSPTTGTKGRTMKVEVAVIPDAIHFLVS